MCSDREKAKVIVGQRDEQEGKGVGSGRVGRALHIYRDAIRLIGEVELIATTCLRRGAYSGTYDEREGRSVK